MKHEEEFIGVEKSDSQAEIHTRAIGRQRSEQAAPGEMSPEPTPQEQQEKAQDAILSWNSGTHIAHVGIGDIALSESIVDVAGVGGVTQFSASEPVLQDSAAGGRLTSAPRIDSGLCGVDEIIGGGH